MIMTCEVVTVDQLLNTYECGCGACWRDEWCCACDDECPICGADVCPSESVALETFQLRLGVDVCPVCDSVHEF